MASRLNPYISFHDTAQEAMEFYRSALGGELTMTTFGQFGTEGEYADRVMHSQLETPAGFTLMASDTPPGTDHTPGSQITISLSGEDEAELRGYWDRLAVGAEITMPLEKQMWGDVFGQLTDRFGIAWLVNVAGEQPAE